MPIRNRPVWQRVCVFEHPIDSTRPQLPKVDGLEILQRCKSDPRTKRIPVVVLSSSREERDLADSYNFGVNSYVVKPVDFSKFTESVRQIGLYWILLNQLPLETHPERQMS